MNALSLTLQDIQKINHKLVDIGIALNPRIDCRKQIGLKYYAHLLLGLNNFQKREHSPTIDALVTLWVYYYAMSKEEEELKRGKGHPTLTSRLYIANLLTNFIKNKEKWPPHYYFKNKRMASNDEHPLLCKSHLDFT